MTSSHPSRFYFSSSIGVGDAMASPRLFGSFSPGPSWDTWRAVVKAAFAEEMTETEVATFRSVADRNPPAKRVRELVCVVGRGGGKDSIASLIATHAAISFDPRGKLRPGERATVMCLACDRHQAGIVHGYIRAYFETIPALKQMLVSASDDCLELCNGVVIEVHTNSFRAVRGRTLLCVIMDECGFWRDETSATPDVEVHGAVTLRNLPVIAVYTGVVYWPFHCKLTATLCPRESIAREGAPARVSRASTPCRRWLN